MSGVKLCGYGQVGEAATSHHWPSLAPPLLWKIAGQRPLVLLFLELHSLDVSVHLGYFLHDFNEDMKVQGRHILLLVDNAPTHCHSASDYSNIRIEFLPPNLTAWIQPMDAGIIRCFKAHYRNRFTRLALDRDDSGIENIYNYNISQLDAMSIASNAWTAVSPSTIANYWRHTGLVTSPPAHSSQQEHSLLEEMARHPNFMHPAFQSLWALMSDRVQTEHEETEEEIAHRLETGLTLDD